MNVSSVFSLRTVAAMMTAAWGYRSKSSLMVDTRANIEELSYVYPTMLVRIS